MGNRLAVERERGAGRKRAGRLIGVRVSSLERSVILSAASHAGLTLSAFLLQSGCLAARSDQNLGAIRAPRARRGCQRTQVLTLWASEADYRSFERAADQSHRSLGRWMRWVALASAGHLPVDEYEERMRKFP